jgi:hypothetical protein
MRGLRRKSEQRIAAAQVSVGGHRRSSEPLTERSHGEPSQAALIEKPRGGR